MRTKIYSILCVVMLQACATTSPISPDADKVQFVDAISISDLDHYEKVGTYTCTEGTSIDACRDYLRNQAALGGAMFLKIYSTTPDHCFLDLAANAPKNCFTVEADGYRKKSPVMLPAPSLPSAQSI